MKFNNCLLVSDIDGTLIEEGYINPKNFEAVDEFVSLGGTFAIATGRCTMAIEHIVCNFKKVDYAIVYNGGTVYNYIKDEPAVESFLEEEDKPFFENLLKEIPDMGIEVYCGKTIYMINGNGPCRAHCQYEHLKPIEATFDDVRHLKWNKILCFYYADYPEEKIVELIKGYKFVNSIFTQAAFSIDGVAYRGYEQLPGGAHKGFGLENLRKILNIPKENTFAIGDYYNDVEMLNTAGISACPKGSPDDIKELANFVAVECKDGAVADFVEYLKNRK